MSSVSAPFILSGAPAPASKLCPSPYTPNGSCDWLGPFATTRTSSMATDRSRYAKIEIPTMVLWGAKDSITPIAQGQDLVHLIPGARLEVLPLAGHIPAIEDERTFNAALLEFLRDTTRTRH